MRGTACLLGRTCTHNVPPERTQHHASSKIRRTGRTQPNRLPSRQHPTYAILSHIWGDDKDEVDFDDLKHKSFKNKAGYAKIRFCGEQAKKVNIEYFWVDTCCINKANNTEYSEAINSMFRWYHDAVKCYVYLADVLIPNGEDHTERIWERAFRNKLLAPASVEFFSREGQWLGSRSTLELQIHEITGIPITALRGTPLSQFSVDDRIQWAAKRNTKKKEDKAYCLLGIFGIFMPLIYGEGDHAFIRLNKELGRSPPSTNLESGNIHPDRGFAFPLEHRKDLGREAVFSVQEWLTASENGNWLLLLDGWDNLNDERMGSLIPHGGSGVILITSRREDWARHGDGLDLPFMKEAASLALLSKSSLTEYGQGNPEEFDAAKEIVRVLGNLPLAVDQAGAHIHNLKTPARKYLSRLKENADTLSWTPPINVWPYGKGVLSAWDLTFQELESSSPKVLEILQVCVFLAGEYISENLLKFGFKFAQKDALARVVEDGMGDLFSFSLAKREGDDDGFSIHTVLQACIRQRLSRLPGLQRQEFTETALLVVAGAVQKLTSERQQDWFSCRQVLSHITSCEKHIDDTLPRKPIFGSTRALFMLGQFCDKFGRHDQAISWFQRELNTVPHLSAQSTLECRDGVSSAKLLKGQYNEALAELHALYTEATAQLGVQHVLTNKIAHSLGMTYKKTGSFENALEWYMASLPQITEIFGEKDHRALATLNNIAVIYKEQKKYGEAFKIYQNVLRKKEEALGEEDLSTLETVMNIGILYWHWKLYDEAPQFLQRALCGKEKQLGKDDPKTLAVKGNIANVYLGSGRLDEAIKLHKETYHGYKKVYGPEHPEVFTKAGWLGEDYCQKRCYAKSLEWYEEALSGRKRLHGEHNAQTLETVVSMAGVFQFQGQFYRALTWYSWALERFRHGFASEHFGTQSAERQLRALILRWHRFSEEMQSRMTSENHPS
ncbi:hypothetical protein AYL99_00660 [Fonsecaea erecta]|uniref:Heterokaryon incompatibility domain-containing protein n=1 Tax=Fonsecaea erecta TaxID=1367422 RepID=A0A178ZXW4_9EURO|nr:hypothetical protein AYL99_00660 [Fonsecaea erecta]OAP64688.1 hypothetical protein AYL99_00660 [Fonsecaea erecta]